MRYKQKPKKSNQDTIEVEDLDWAVGLSDESEAEDSIERDPDWVKTPRAPPPQRRSGRRTQSAEATSLPPVNNSAREQVRAKCH